MKTIVSMIVFFAVFSVLFSGCVEKGLKPSNLTPTPQIILPTPKIPENATGVVDLATKDLADRLKIPIKSIQVLKVIPVVWRDTSLGHPEPGKVYAPVLTPGYVIILLADNALYEYHSDYEHVVPPPDLREMII